MFMFNSNEPIKVVHLQKLANQLMLNNALWSFDKARKVLIEKNKDMGQKYIYARFR